jgi:hypothetical protein
VKKSEHHPISFRAEFPIDVTRAIAKLFALDDALTIKSVKVDVIDSEVELWTRLELDLVLAALRTIEDSHVMVQTLHPCPLEENTLERNYERT